MNRREDDSVQEQEDAKGLSKRAIKRQARKTIIARMAVLRPEYTDVEIHSAAGTYWYCTATREGRPLVSNGVYTMQLKYARAEDFIEALDAVFS